MSQHPLIELSQDREVRQAKGFRAAALRLNGEVLAEKFRTEVAHAPRRHDAGQKYLVAQTGKRGRRSARPEPPLSTALVNHRRDAGGGLPLPEEEGQLEFVAYQLPLKAGSEDPGLGKIDVLGMLPGDRLAVVKLKYVAPQATRGSTGDTPLRALLEALAAAAVVQANHEALAGELAESLERSVSTEPPAVVLLGTPRYWELCRKREAQKGAGWIKEMERLAKEIVEAFGVPVHFFAIELAGDPAWEDRDERVLLTDVPKLAPAWEAGAGRVRPKPRPRPKATAVETVVEADLSRPVQPYALTGSFQAGDRIAHPTLGEGVVQGPAGPGKIKVLFDNRPALLVHERGPSTG